MGQPCHYPAVDDQGLERARFALSTLLEGNERLTHPDAAAIAEDAGLPLADVQAALDVRVQGADQQVG